MTNAHCGNTHVYDSNDTQGGRERYTVHFYKDCVQCRGIALVNVLATVWKKYTPARLCSKTNSREPDALNV